MGIALERLKRWAGQWPALSILLFVLTIALIGWAACHALAQTSAESETPVTSDSQNEPNSSGSNASEIGGEPAQPQAPKLPEPKGAQRLSREYDVWLDVERGVVIVDGLISLREGMLEMFACTRNTKEHESIVSANTKAFLVHAALLRLGAEPGTPVQFVPEYKPPTGTEIEITVEWLNEAGETKTARAQDWVQHMGTKTAMSHPFVFAGSRFWTDPDSGKQYYQAESGDFICVSNFSTAMLDIPVPSSQANDQLAFQAFTERIPPLGAPVRLILKPKLEAKPSASAPQQKTRDDDRAAKAD